MKSTCEQRDNPYGVTDCLCCQTTTAPADDDGVLRVGGTRVRLETVINAFQAGCAAEEILLKHPSTQLTDIYAVITYYLWHRAEVDAYLTERRGLADKVRQENETRWLAGWSPRAAAGTS